MRIPKIQIIHKNNNIFRLLIKFKDEQFTYDGNIYNFAAREDIFNFVSCGMQTTNIPALKLLIIYYLYFCNSSLGLFQEDVDLGWIKSRFIDYIPNIDLYIPCMKRQINLHQKNVKKIISI